MDPVTIDPSAVAQAADILYQARTSGTPAAPVRELLPAGDLAAAYAVQDHNTRRWIAEGRQVVGKKCGLTSQAVQRQLGVGQPDYGVLFADMAVPEGCEIERRQLIQPRAEAEVAFVMGRDLDREELAMDDVLRAVDCAVGAIEIVDSRIADWKIGIVDTIADNASSGVYVLGAHPRRIHDVDLRLCGMVMECRGEVVSLGVGAACLGHPLNAVLWLAQVMARAGRPLRAGDTVLSGALGPLAPVRWGEAIEAHIQGFGSVRAAFAKE
jgi:2-keto-4-pentenoate hydratase